MNLTVQKRPTSTTRPVPLGHASGRDAPWQFRFLIAASSGLVWSVLVYQKTFRCFSAPFPSELSAVYILCTTSSFVPPWKGIISPWSLNPRSTYSVTLTPRLQASSVAAMMGEALNVGVCLYTYADLAYAPYSKRRGRTDMKTLLFAQRMALSQATSCGCWPTW